jgi:hypothetical protein
MQNIAEDLVKNANSLILVSDPDIEIMGESDSN